MSLCWQLHFHALFLVLLLVLFISSSSAQPDFQHYFCNNTNTNSNSNSTTTFTTNLNTLFTTLTASTSTATFYNLTTGKNSGVDQVNAIALCRADVSPPDCHSCISDAARKIRAACPTQSEAIGWYNNCMLRYSTLSIFNTMQPNPIYAVSGNVTSNVSDKDMFKQQLGTLLRRLQDAAAAGETRKYGYGFGVVSNLVNVYAQVECTPDLSESECYNCFQGANSYITRCCNDSERVTTKSPSCDIRYDNTKIYNVLEDQSPVMVPLPFSQSPLVPSTSATNNGTSTTTSPAVQKSKKSSNNIAIAIPTVASSTILVIIIVVSSILWKKKKSRKPRANSTKDEIAILRSLQFKFGAIKRATRGFSCDNKLGQGGFGVVYKGQLPDGQEVAVKRLLRKTMQGDAQFKNEILTLAKLDHRNLVRLLGFCLEEDEILLIYELVANGSLDRFIFDPVQRASMQWATHYRIINGIARGLLYLHEDSRLRIIHRDLKAGNVLIDANFNPKIADFGMARLFNIDHTQSVASKIVGTYGYMAPEYALHGYVSMKSDVYSFGVIVLEVISGQRIGTFQNEESSEGMLSYAWKNWMEGTPLKFVDAMLSVDGFSTEILRCTHVGLLCVQHNPADRPTMSLVALMLSSYSHSLPVPSPPGFFSKGNIQPKVPFPGHTSDQTSDTLRTYSVNEVSITEIDPR